MTKAISEDSWVAVRAGGSGRYVCVSKYVQVLLNVYDLVHKDELKTTNHVRQS